MTDDIYTARRELLNQPTTETEYHFGYLWGLSLNRGGIRVNARAYRNAAARMHDQPVNRAHCLGVARGIRQGASPDAL